MREAVALHSGSDVHLGREAVLAAVRLIHKNDDVVAQGQLRELTVLVWSELVDGGKHHTTHLPIQPTAKLGDLLNLLRVLPKELLAP